jgi:acid phosphatase (class A)
MDRFQSRRIQWTVSLFLALACVVAAYADAPQPAVHYLTKDCIDFAALLPPPPTRPSEEQDAEISAVLAAQEARTPAEAARAKAEERFTVFAFSDVLGPAFNAKTCPTASVLFKDVDDESHDYTVPAKNHWYRLRPPTVDSRVHPCVSMETGYSYPSGHATRGELMAELLAEVFPDQRDALLARGREIGWDRVIGGIHYPSDISAGRVLGHALVKPFLANPDFVAALHRVKIEYDQARQAMPTTRAFDGVQ